MQDGILIPVLDKTRFEYSYLTAAQSQTIQISRQINVVPFYRVQLIVTIHALTISAGQTWNFNLSNTMPSESDPRDLSENPSGTQFMTVTLNTSTPPAPVVVSGSATDPGAFLKVWLQANQDAASAPTMYAEFSAAVLLRKS